MIRRHRHSISVFFLALLMLPFLLHFSLLARQSRIRHRMEHELEVSKLHTLELKNEEIRWAKPGKELWIGDRLFDVESVSAGKNKTVFTGLFDNEETDIRNLVNRQHDQDKSGATKFISLLSIAQVLQPVQTDPSLPTYLKNTAKATFIAGKLSPAFTAQPTPPPDCC